MTIEDDVIEQSVIQSSLSVSVLSLLSLLRFRFGRFSPVLIEPGPGVVAVILVASVLSRSSQSWSLVHPGVVLIGSRCLLSCRCWLLLSFMCWSARSLLVKLYLHSFVAGSFVPALAVAC